MALRVTNNIHLLVRAVEETEEKARDESRKAAEQAGRFLLPLMTTYAPEGKDEPSFTARSGKTISHGRPSIRQGHGALKSQWSRPRIVTTKEGATVFIQSTAFHMLILLEGIPANTIRQSGRTPLTFWSFKRGKAVETREIDHPGFEAFPFPREAMDDIGTSRVRRILGDGARETLSPIRDIF